MQSASTAAPIVTPRRFIDLRAATTGALLVGAALWIAAAFIGGDDGATRFYIAEAVWLPAQLALLAGTIGLWQRCLHGSRRSGTLGFALATAGRVAFVVAELVALAQGVTADAVLPVAAILTAVGMVIGGIATARERRLSGLARFTLLAAGVFPFVAMFPFAATSPDGPPPATLGAWGATFGAIGIAAAVDRRRQRTTRPPSSPSTSDEEGRFTEVDGHPVERLSRDGPDRESLRS